MTAAGLDDRVLVRLRENCTLADGRRVGPRGLFGSLHAVHCADAQRLVELGLAKLPAALKFSRYDLRLLCERHDDAATL